MVKSRRSASSRASPKRDRLGPPAVEVRAVAPERGDLDLARPFGAEHPDHAEADADGDRPPEQAHHLLGRRVGGHVVVARLQAEDQVADATARPERLEPCGFQAGDDLGREGSASLIRRHRWGPRRRRLLGRLADRPDRDLRPAVAADVPRFEVGQDLDVELPARLRADDRAVGQSPDEPFEELAHPFGVVLVVGIRRVDEDDHRLAFDRDVGLRPPIGVGHDHLGPVFVAEGRDVPADQGRVLAVPLDEDGPLRPPAQGLKPKRAGAGEQVEDQQAFDGLAQDVEHRLADEVAGRPGHLVLRPVELVPPALAGDDPHDSTLPTGPLATGRGTILPEVAVRFTAGDSRAGPIASSRPP